MSASQLPLETLLAILMLLFYTISAPLFEKYHFHYMHESGLCMLIGIGITAIAMIINPEVFFTFILPPIIFAAGYNLRRRSFFKYFVYIFLFGVVGTLITFCIVTPLTYIANANGLFTVTFGKEYEEMSNHMVNGTDQNILQAESLVINFSLREILLFSSVIAATDTVAALTFIKEENEPKLFAILFGEGVINDAVCIVLYGIIKNFTEEFTVKTPFKMLGSFMSMFFFSFIIGAGVGCLSSIFFKKMKEYNLNRVQECSIIIFFAFISYTLTEELGLSPIIALLFTGIFMSHYTFYNLSFQAREESSVVSRIMSNIAEAFVFTYLGLTVIYNTIMAFSFSFFFYELIFVVLGRVVAIYGISFVMSKLQVRAFSIKNSQKGIMSCAGSIRGAIAFGLAISIDTNNKVNKEVLISSTLMLVLFTTIVFGALMPKLIQFFSSFDKKEESHQAKLYEMKDLDNEIQFDYLHPNFSKEVIIESKEKDKSKLKQRLSYWLGTYWKEFDDIFMKPKLIYNWPAVKSEQDQVSAIINGVIESYKKDKEDEIEQLDDQNNLNEDISPRRMSRDEIRFGTDSWDNYKDRMLTK